MRAIRLGEVDVASSGKNYEVKLNARSGKGVKVKLDRTPESGHEAAQGGEAESRQGRAHDHRGVKRADLRAIELDRWRGRVV